MRVLLDATVLEHPATGIAKTTLGLYDACRKQEPSLQVCALHQKRLAVDLPLALQPCKRGFRLPARLWRRLVIPYVASPRDFDIAHFPWNGGVPRLSSRLTIVTTLHDVLPLIIPGYFRSILSERIYRIKKQRDIMRTDVLITDSEYSRRCILDNFQMRSEPMVIYHGPTLDRTSRNKNSGQPNRDEYFLYVGGWDLRKGLIPLLKVFVALHRENRIASKLFLTGNRNYFSDEFRRLLEEAVSMGIVEERGYVSDSQLANLLVNAKALVYPSRYEGFGLPPLEAMHLGCPVITTRCTSIPEVCGDAVLYVEPDDQLDFAHALITIEINPGVRKELALKGLAQASRFTWENAAQKFLSALQPTIEKNRVGRRGAGSWRR